MEILWAIVVFFVTIAGVTKFVERANNKEAYKRAIKISRGK